MILAFIFIPESPRFLFAKGDIEGLKKALQKIAKINNANVNLSELKALD